MFSGKTSELLRLVERQQIAKRRCVLIRYSKGTRSLSPLTPDDRYSTDCVATHHGQQMPAVSATTLRSVLPECLNYDVVGIDEGQFFPDVVDVADELANYGKVVIIASLDGTFERLPFPSRVLDLVARAEHVVKLHAVCSVCGGNAPFSKRLSQEKDVQVIGGADKYIAVCRACHHAADATPKQMPAGRVAPAQVLPAVGSTIRMW